VVWFGSMADDGNKSGKKNGTLHPNEQKRSSGTPVLGDLVKAESMIQLALMLPAGCVIGALAGVALDKHFHTGWIVVVGILLGAAGGFVQIYRTASHYMKKDD
jgi:ATP synthase protein I